MNLENMVIEPMVVELLKDAAHIKEVKIINCHVKGNIEKAIKGKNVGTIIRADSSPVPYRDVIFTLNEFPLTVSEREKKIGLV